MKLRIHHSFGVEPIIVLLKGQRERGERGKRLERTISCLKALRRKGVKVASFCPQAIEVQPGVWACPGHTVQRCMRRGPVAKRKARM